MTQSHSGLGHRISISSALRNRIAQIARLQETSTETHHVLGKRRSTKHTRNISFLQIWRQHWRMKYLSPAALPNLESHICLVRDLLVIRVTNLISSFWMLVICSCTHNLWCGRRYISAGPGKASLGAYQKHSDKANRMDDNKFVSLEGELIRKLIKQFCDWRCVCNETAWATANNGRIKSTQNCMPFTPARV